MGTIVTFLHSFISCYGKVSLYKVICIFSTRPALMKFGPPSSGFVCLFVLRLNVPVNKFSVMSGRSKRFMGITSTIGEKSV